MLPEADRLSPAIQTYLNRYANLVRQAGARRGLSEADIDEVFQDVRIRLWRALEKREKPDDIPASYIYKTAASAALDLIRRRRARREEEGSDIEQSRFAERANPEHELEASEVAEQVAEAVDEITPSRRPVVRMHLLGYHRSEIARLMGWSEAKTRNLLYRGLAELRARLAQHGLGPREALR